MSASKPPRDGNGHPQDGLVMRTNDSSIVSKRSVERLYFPDEPHFFRYFVKKFQRRSPLINRGYFLRMRAVERMVLQFLDEKSDRPRYVVNLGCGYDPLPFQFLTRYPRSKDVVFVDVDFEELLVKKLGIINDTKELRSMLINPEIPEQGNVLLRSREYVALAANLRDLKRFDELFSGVIDSDEAPILFLAEVSITYMQTVAADALIEWAGTFSNARFCLLEQILPRGRNHPFAQTMLAHFAKLHTPLYSVERYSSVQLQRQRFERLGWKDARGNSLMDLWNDLNFLSVSERRYLDKVEPFDEWEDFTLFASHYIVLLADNSRAYITSNRGLSCESLVSKPPPESMAVAIPFVSLPIYYSLCPKSEGRKKFGAPVLFRHSGALVKTAANFGGSGLRIRTNSFDVYSSSQATSVPLNCQNRGAVPASRMCHTITELGDAGALLVGGRASPESVFHDCWLYHKWLNAWERVEDLPRPRYRHGAVNLGHGYVLISTGKRNALEVADEYYVWSRSFGWKRCLIAAGQSPPSPTYGATLIVSNSGEQNSVLRCGLLAGGLSADGLFQTGTWEWQVSHFKSEQPVLSFKRLISPPINTSLTSLARFGAAVAYLDDWCYIIGGVKQDGLLSASEEICVLNLRSNKLHAVLMNSEISAEPAPLLIGVSVISTSSTLLIMGGGVVCFSFGSFWNQGCFHFAHCPEESCTTGTVPQDLAVVKKEAWRFIGTRTLSRSSVREVQEVESPLREGTQIRVNIPRVRISSAHEFEQILNASTPVILEGLDIGTCTEAWDTESLKNRIGADRQVIIHEAETERMNFITKNFAYASRRLGDFLDSAEAGERVYMRSLSAQDVPANFWHDFPSIASDFKIPSELPMIENNIHSSVLRISGATKMWLHYDVMNNILCQVRGSKTLLVFHPSDVRYLEFEPGASSSEVDVFTDCIAKTTPHEALMRSGDILYIPPCWLHASSPNSGLSVAVNIFFRNMKSYAAGRDTYGNRDLQAYENGRHAISRMVDSFRPVPVDVRNFYLQRLAAELAQKASS